MRWAVNPFPQGGGKQGGVNPPPSGRRYIGGVLSPSGRLDAVMPDKPAARRRQTFPPLLRAARCAGR